MRRQRRNCGDDAVAEECAAFLTGTLADRWEASGVSVPIWAWTNLLAHGNRDMIADAVSQPARHRLLSRSWWMARAQLADLILTMTSRGSLRDLQECVLIPLELDLAGRNDVMFWSSRQWAHAVTAELHRYDHTSQSS